MIPSGTRSAAPARIEGASAPASAAAARGAIRAHASAPAPDRVAIPGPPIDGHRSQGSAVGRLLRFADSARAAHDGLAAGPRRTSRRPDTLTLGLLAALLTISAAMTAFACTSPTLGITAWFSLLPLFLAVRILRPSEALIAGGLWGLALFAALQALGQSFAVSGTTSLLLLVTVPAIYTWLGASVTRWTGFHPLLLGLGWVGVEVALRPLSLRNGLLTGTQGNGLIVRLVGGVLGYLLVAFLLALANALVLSFLSEIPGGKAPTLVKLPPAADLLPGSAASPLFHAWTGRAARSRAPPTVHPLLHPSSITA